MPSSSSSSSISMMMMMMMLPLPLGLRLKGKVKQQQQQQALPTPPSDQPFSSAAAKELQTISNLGVVRMVDGGEDTPPVIRSADIDIISEDKKMQLEFEIINLEAVQIIVNCGHLDGGMRALSWKLLLGYLSAERDSWKVEFIDNRLRYAELKEELILNPSEFSRKQDKMFSFSKSVKENDVDEPLSQHSICNRDHLLSLGNASIWYQYLKDAETIDQISRDLQRTHQDITFFSGNSSLGKNNQEIMRNILLLFAKVNPVIGYVQGMNVVLAPLCYVFRTDSDEQNVAYAEEDSFWCFVRLMSDSVDHFCQQLDDSSVGIHSTLSHLSELLKVNDDELWRHLDIFKVNPQFYAFRWIILLLTQEFEFHSIMRIWDSLLSNPLGEMLLRVCCAVLVSVRYELLSGDFMSNLKLLQRYPKINVEYILDEAQKLNSKLVLSPARVLTMSRYTNK